MVFEISKYWESCVWVTEPISWMVERVNHLNRSRCAQKLENQNSDLYLSSQWTNKTKTDMDKTLVNHWSMDVQLYSPFLLHWQIKKKPWIFRNCAGSFKWAGNHSCQTSRSIKKHEKTKLNTNPKQKQQAI